MNKYKINYNNLTDDNISDIINLMRNNLTSNVGLIPSRDLSGVEIKKVYQEDSFSFDVIFKIRKNKLSQPPSNAKETKTFAIRMERCLRGLGKTIEFKFLPKTNVYFDKKVIIIGYTVIGENIFNSKNPSAENKTIDFNVCEIGNPVIDKDVIEANSPESWFHIS